MVIRCVWTQTRVSPSHHHHTTHAHKCTHTHTLVHTHMTHTYTYHTHTHTPHTPHTHNTHTHAHTHTHTPHTPYTPHTHTHTHTHTPHTFTFVSASKRCCTCLVDGMGTRTLVTCGDLMWREELGSVYVPTRHWWYVLHHS